jgi:putative membrane protein
MSDAPGATPNDARFRDHAANERTLLAWIRTGIALMAFGFAIARFGLFLREIVEVGHVRAPRGTGSAWFGVALVLLGLVTNVAATARYARARRALLAGGEVPASPLLVYGVGIASALVAAAMAVMLARTLVE